MTNYWIFTVKDQKIGNERKKGIDIYKQRMVDRFWGLKETTANRRHLKPEDKVVFYLSGKEGKKFLGATTVDSKHHKLSKEEKKEVSHGSFFQSAYGVKLKQIKIWKSAKPISPLLPKLKFITNQKRWGVHLHGSIKRISKDDYNTIIEFSEETSNTNIVTIGQSFPKSIADLRLEQELTHNQICQIFKCGARGGMKRSNSTGTLLLISDHTKPFYEDRWEDGTLYYTGMGLTGNQSLDFRQNKTLAKSRENEVEIHLVEVFEKRKYIYRGQVKLSSEPQEETQLDMKGNKRSVWVFPLKLVNGKN